MNGWKTWAGVAGLVVGAALMAGGFSDLAMTVYSLAVPMVILGVGHKLDKVWSTLHLVAKGLDSAATEMEKASASIASAPAPVTNVAVAVEAPKA